jgi:hypothetical protein
MIDRRFNELAVPDDPSAATATVELDIVTVQLQFDDTAGGERFPIIEVLDVGILDRRTGERHRGIVGNNFSSYLRDYDFSVVLPAATAAPARSLFRRTSAPARPALPALPDIGCLPAALRGISGDLHQRVDERTYRRTGLVHPALGAEYQQDDFAHRRILRPDGLQVRYFMPRGAVAPLAFYFRGDLLNDFSDLQLIGTIARWRRSRRSIVPRCTTPSARRRVYRPTRPGRLRPHGHRLRPRSAASSPSPRAATPRSTS